MNNTHLTTQLTDITEQIKRLDVEALKLAQSAKIGILQATDKACGVGSLLKEAQQLVGRVITQSGWRLRSATSSVIELSATARH